MGMKNKVNYLLISVIMVILGICMIAKPGNSAELICVAIGIALLVISALLIIRFLSAEEKTLSQQILLAIGVVIAIFGLSDRHRCADRRYFQGDQGAGNKGARPREVVARAAARARDMRTGSAADL